MGIFNNKDNVRTSCDKNINTGEVICKRVRVNPDGTTVELASIINTVDANCNVTPLNETENEEGQLNELKKRVGNNMKAVCTKNQPAEY